MSSNAIGQHQVILVGLSVLAGGGGGTTKAEHDAFVEIKLACEQEKHLSRWRTLLKVRTTEHRARFCSDLQVSIYELQIPQE